MNDVATVEAVMQNSGDRTAAIIVEPVVANMGLVLPFLGFLEALREQAQRHGALLIFDEVITGFRFGPAPYGVLCGAFTCFFRGGLPRNLSEAKTADCSAYGSFFHAMLERGDRSAARLV